MINITPPSLSTDASELSDKHSDSTVQVKVTRPRQLWQPLSSWKRRNKVVPSPQAKQKVSTVTAPLSSSETLSDKENLGPSSSPPPPPPLHPLRRKMEKLNITSSGDLLSTFAPVSPLYQEPEGKREGERERGREGERADVHLLKKFPIAFILFFTPTAVCSHSCLNILIRNVHHCSDCTLH